MKKYIVKILENTRVGYYILKLPLIDMLIYLIWGEKEWAKKTAIKNWGRRYLENKLSVRKYKKYMRIEQGLYGYGTFNMCYLNNMLANMLLVLEEGFLPIIELKDRKEGYNDWKVYFEQPFGKATNDMIEICKCDRSPLYPTFGDMYDSDMIKLWCGIYHRLVKYNEKTEKYINKEYEQLIPKNKKILAVICRGTDYIKLQPKDHPVQPKIENVMQVVKQKINDLHIDYIYLATEDEEIYQAMEQTFPGKILVNKRHYYGRQYREQQANYIGEVTFGEEDEKYQMGIEYLSSLFIASKCNALVAGNCGGAQGAIFMNNLQYEDCYLFDLGYYD